MHAPWFCLVAAVLLAACPFAAQADDTPSSTAAPERLVVDSDSAPVVSIHGPSQAVEIVLIPSGDYRPIHPDSLETDTNDASTDANTAK